MNYPKKEDNGHDSISPALGSLESPFLTNELFRTESPGKDYDNASIIASESPYFQLNPKAFQEEILGTDDRILVTDTLKIPNQWICAIDILIDNPLWGKFGEAQFITKSRATGILIGPRYVLTAGHILNKQTIDISGEKKSVDVKELTVSPARNLKNSQNPFGRIRSKAVRVSQPYRVLRRVSQGSRVMEIPVQVRDDYALIILEKDLDLSTHSRVPGTLGYWGTNPAVALVRRMEPGTINGKDVVIIGYPGDTCGKNKFSGSKSEKERKISTCWNRQKDEWACTQWRSAGTLEIENNSTTVFHTADTYEGQSGAPICLSLDQRLHLVAIHTASHDAQKNKGVRVTRRMLREICGWMNADASYNIATIQDDTLVVRPKNSTSSGELFDGFGEDEALIDDFAGDEGSLRESTLDRDLSLNLLEADDNDFPSGEMEDLNSVDYVDDEIGVRYEEPFEERFDPSTVPKDVSDALGRKDWPLALKRAIQAGWRDENELTNLIFFTRHPELPIQPLDSKDPNFKKLGVEWGTINNDVWKAIQVSAENTDLVVSGKEVSDHHRSFFRGKSGKRLKKLIEDAAKEVDLNAGLLGTIMMAETRRPLSYLSGDKVSSYHIGADDFYEGRAAIKARVPAYAKVKWDRHQTPSAHPNDAKTNPRTVKTIVFDSGPDAVLATAVYLKFREVRLREIATELKGDFDKLPLGVQFALTRMAMAAGTGGATPYLKEALKGVDIFVRRDIPVRAYQTKRNATVRTAQAMHLSEWIFGVPVPAVVAQPELGILEGFDEAEFSDNEFQDKPEEFYNYVDPDLDRESGYADIETGEDATNYDIETRELDPVLMDLAERTMAREIPFFEQQAPKRWTTCFSAEDIERVKRAYEENAAAAGSSGTDRCSCIVMLNVALGQLLPLRLKTKPARSTSGRQVQMGDLTTETIEKAMEQLRKRGFTAGPIAMNFYDKRGRTAGTLKPERLKASVQAKVLAKSKTEGCWFAFGLSIMDGYHSVLLVVDHTGADAKIYWLDQFSATLNDDVTTGLDQRLTERTQDWWQSVMDTKGKGYNTTIRLWPLRKPL